jgi:hypothetical protein
MKEYTQSTETGQTKVRPKVVGRENRMRMVYHRGKSEMQITMTILRFRF